MSADLRELVTCEHWRWMPGMKVVTTAPGGHMKTPAGYESWIQGPDELGDLIAEGHFGHLPEDAWPGDDDWPVPLPDPNDPATRGCLLELVREAWGDERTSVCANTVYGTWLVLVPDGSSLSGERMVSCEATEWEALAAALLAAPKKGA